MSTLTETPLKPKPGFRKAALLLIVAALVVGVASIGLSFVRGHFTLQSIPDLLLGAIAMIALVAMVSLENKRAHAVELTTEAVSSLTWKFSIGLLPCRLVPIRMRWDEIQQIAHKGFAVSFKGASGEIALNTYLLDDPAKVIDFINAQIAKVAAAQKKHGAGPS